MVDRTDLDEVSALSVVREPAIVPYLVAEGPVRYLLASGDLDSGAWGMIGAFWLSIDGERGGFIVSIDALWQGSEMARSYRSALRRGWSHEGIYGWWQGRVGVASGNLMVDPQQHADSLLQVYRRVGAI